jgi:hypothetical protein
MIPRLSPYGLSPYGSSLYGSPPGPFGLQGATSLLPVIVQVRFNDLLDLANPALVNPANYVITPPLGVHTVNIETAGSVRLTTDYITAGIYTVRVANMTSSTDAPVDVTLRDATFDGFPTINGFLPVGVSRRKVRLIFPDYMEVNAALTDPASYRITSPHGVDLPVIGVIAEGPFLQPVAVALILGADLVPRGVHTARIVTTNVHDHIGHAIVPDVMNFRWVPRVPSVIARIRDFSGEATDGLLGRPAGMVFFSPALGVAAPNSALQVDDVSVCTRAHDVYQFPNPPDPSVLFVFKPGVNAGTLTSSRVTFASFEKLGGARIIVSDLRLDTLAHGHDSRCIATLVETLDPARAPRLNAVAYAAAPPRAAIWPIFDGISATPFTTAANLTPIPPGTTTVRTLQP